MTEILLDLYFIIPLLFLVITIALTINGRKKLKQCAECTGKIVDLYEHTSGPFVDAGEKRVSPVISYSVDGQDYRFTGSYYSTNMAVGKDVRVLYDRENPGRASVKTVIFFAPLITGILTIASVIPAVVFAIVK